MSNPKRPPPPKGRGFALGLAFVIVCLTLVAFWPSLDNGFTNWDDNAYVTENPDIKAFTLPNVGKVFSSQYQANYHPLTMVTYMAEHWLFQLDATAYHRTNLALHCVNALLVLALFLALSKSRLVGATVAVLFAVHPFRVESVAWIAERKDVLSGLFFLASLLFYVQATRDGARRYRWLCGGALLGSLLAKPMAVSQPLVLLGIDYLAGRPIDRRALVEKIPYAALAAGFAAIALVTQRVALDDPGHLGVSLSLVERLGVPFYGLAFYIFGTIAPVGLCANHPFPNAGDGAALAQLLAAPVLVAGCAVAVYHLRARSRAVVFGALFFLVTALPILQIVLIGTAAVTERYTYLPALGIYFVAAVGLRHLFLVTFARNQVARVCLAAGAGAAILALCSLTHARCGVWRDSLSLWNDVIAKHPSALAYNNRGIYHAQHHDLARAVDDLEHALRLRPTYALAYFNRANVYRNLGDLDRSLADNSLAIRWCPTYVLAYYHRGVTYCLKGDYDHGIADLSQTIALNPNHAGALLNRGLAYERQNDRERAAQDFARACALGESTACQILSHG